MRRLKALCLLLIVSFVLSACGLGNDDSGRRVVAYFRDVGDLVNAATVQVNDVEVGSVADISLVLQDGDMVARVEMVLGDSIQVPKEGLTALIRQTSLLGEQFVALEPTTEGAPFVGAGETVVPLERTDKRVDIETFLGDLSAFIGQGGLEDLNRFTHAQAVILEGRGDTLGSTIDELEEFTGILADRKEDVAEAIDQLGLAGRTLANNQDTIDDFFDSLQKGNAILADQTDELAGLFRALNKFGKVNSRFLAKHEDAINRQFKSLRPVLEGLAGAKRELGIDLAQLKTFFNLFPKSLGGGPGGTSTGDYIQADAVLCEHLYLCNVRGEKGDVPGEGS